MLTAKWLNIITAFGVFVATITIRLQLSSNFGAGEKGALIFTIAILFAGIYETTIKPRKKLGLSNIQIIIEVLWVWILPAFVGYFTANFLK